MYFIGRNCRCICCDKHIRTTDQEIYYDTNFHKVDETQWKRLTIETEVNNKQYSNMIGYICPECLDKYKIVVRDFD